jgi:integrase
VKPPRVDKKEAAHYDETVAERMLMLLDNEQLKYKTMIYITIYSGCRLGELSGLEWSDVDFENNLLRFRQASQYIPGQGTFTKAPKNDSSIRVISMPLVAMSLLRQYRVWQNEERLKCGDLWQDHDRLFTQLNGLPIHPSTPSKWFSSFRQKYGLPDLKFHGLRHTNATLLIGEGVDPQTVAKRLGHAKTTTTTTVYSHFLRKPDQGAVAKLENLFGKNKKDESKKA